MTCDFIAGFIQIVIIDLALSGNNTLVIGMAGASLPHNLRIKAIIIGGGCAILLRISLTAIVTTLIKVTSISAIAGAVLFWVAWKLLKCRSRPWQLHFNHCWPADQYAPADDYRGVGSSLN
jgi:predicted tellurium resistance membrane protein TerC